MTIEKYFKIIFIYYINSLLNKGLMRKYKNLRRKIITDEWYVIII